MTSKKGSIKSPSKESTRHVESVLKALDVLDCFSSGCLGWGGISQLHGVVEGRAGWVLVERWTNKWDKWANAQPCVAANRG